MARRRQTPSITAMTTAMRAHARPWTRPELEERWSRTTLSEATRLGFVTRIAPAQYVHREHAADPGCRIAAAAAWMAPHGTLSGPAALWLHGWRGTELSHVDVVLPRDVHLVRPPFVRTLRTEAAIVTLEVEGMPVATPEDATVLAWRRANPHDRRGLVLDILRDGPVDPVRLAARIDAHRRLPDRAELRRLVAISRDGVHSMLEHLAATDVFVGPEWAEWERQGEVPTAVGRVLHPDMVHRAARVAVELDGARFHSADAQRRRDIERDALLASVGYSVIRLTWEDVTRRPDWCRQTLRAAVAARAA